VVQNGRGQELCELLRRECSRKMIRSRTGNKNELRRVGLRKPGKGSQRVGYLIGTMEKGWLKVADELLQTLKETVNRVRRKRDGKEG